MAAALREEGFEVFGTSFQNEKTDEFVTKIDLRDSALVRDYVSQLMPSVVVHLAAISFVGHEDASEIYGMNIAGTRNLLQGLASSAKPPKSIVLASSANIYGNSKSDPITESADIRPENDYAVSKFAMELMARIWVNRLPITVVRPFNYTGRGQSTNFLVPKIVEALKAGHKEISLGNLEVARDFSDVRTVAWVYSQLATKPAPGEVFNIASGSSISLSEILSKLCVIAGYRIGVSSVSDLRRSGEISRLRGDASRLWQHVGQPPQISFDETLAWMMRHD